MCVNISQHEHVLLILYKKKPVFSFEIPGPALVLLPILPTITFHQKTNRGLRKGIRVFLTIHY